MGHQIIQQPDGKLAVFSSITDSWVVYDASPEELEDYYAEKAADEARKSASKTIASVLAGERTYFQFTMTFEEADDTVAEAGQTRLADLPRDKPPGPVMHEIQMVREGGWLLWSAMYAEGFAVSAPHTLNAEGLVIVQDRELPDGEWVEIARYENGYPA